ncbi:hypothetical protein [Erwinia sp. HR93]|uniref:hypothetical protein n=1 Tax=Erwinia sp. HR93 TaxID=3094840 RepID=UPI002ADED3CB|nr:hypothetical protein [Erwinia sp. HR93]MEA1064983.1 hypothetical protein [Erwinia sp. HR93]
MSTAAKACKRQDNWPGITLPGVLPMTLRMVLRQIPVGERPRRTLLTKFSQFPTSWEAWMPLLLIAIALQTIP